VVLHGGPGGGSTPKYRQFFDPQVYRIVNFDQRGAGHSTPAASLVDNTTWHLVEDVERLRKHLNIDRWVVFGGSWGSTLALAYAETHPTVVKALILRGIFMCRRSELEWFYQAGAHNIYPDAWEHYLKPIPLVERHDMMSAYHRRLTGPDEREALACASAWSLWEMSTSALIQNPELLAKAEDPAFSLKFARIECHYFVNGAFMRNDQQLLEDVGAIRQIPTYIVQGRYDIVCPIVSAWDLHKAFPESELHIVANAGHSAGEPGIVHHLVTAADKYKHL